MEREEEKNARCAWMVGCCPGVKARGGGRQGGVGGRQGGVGWDGVGESVHTYHGPPTWR